MTDAIDTAIDEAWTQGLFRGDAARLRRLGAATPDHARAGELMAFARLAALHEDQTDDEAWEGVPDADPAVQVLDRAARAWHATRWRRADDAAVTLDALDAALAALPASGAHAHAARALADLALAEIAITCRDLVAARRRLETIVRRQVPAGTAILARLALALRAGKRDHGAATASRNLLDAAAELARHSGRVADAARAKLHAGVLSAFTGDVAGAITRLERVLAEATDAIADADLALVARIVLAGLREGDRGFDDLGRGLAIAAARGDYFGTVTLLVLASRKAQALGRLADAIAILDNGAAQLAVQVGDAATRPLLDARDRLRDGVDVEVFEAAERDAERQRARDRAIAPAPRVS